MLIRRVRIYFLAAAMALFGVGLISVSASALTIPPKPTDMPIVDQTQTLTAEQKTALAQKIAAERTATGNEIGVLLLIVKNDRRLRIEVGYGLEGALPDIRANQIIRDRIRPAFQQNDFYGGIEAGVDGIIKAVHGEVDPKLSQPKSAASLTNFPWEVVIFFAVMGFSWLGAILGRTKSWWAGGVIGGIFGAIIGFLSGALVVGIGSVIILAIAGLFFDKVVSANYRSHARRGDTPSWWAGGPFLGGGGSSGGGFGGFGGGGFGGGGASGDW